MCGNGIDAHARARLAQIGSNARGAVGAMRLSVMADDLHVQICSHLLNEC